MKKIILNSIFLFLICSFALANRASYTDKTDTPLFEENVGQLRDDNGQPANYVLYTVKQPNLNIFITTSGITYYFYTNKDIGRKIENEKNYFSDSLEQQWYRVDMILKGATISREKIVQEGGVENSQTDYYYPHCSDGIKNVMKYNKVVIKNIYQGIDWVLYNKNGKLKYDFIIHKGADYKQVELLYEGGGNFKFTENQLSFGNEIGTLAEGNLYCFDAEKEIESSYNVRKNSHYHLMKSDKKEKQNHLVLDNEFSYSVNITLNANEEHIVYPLVIDPYLNWATYYGAISEDAATSVHASGLYVWVTGYSYSTAFPLLNPGGTAYYQGTKAGSGTDAFILKFNTNGQRLWATYYGGGTGASYTRGLSIFSTNSTVWVTGYVNASAFPLHNPGGGAYFQNTAGGGDDAFILKFNTTGERLWATYYGGSGNELGHSIHFDGTNVWVTGETGSNNFPVLDPGGATYFDGFYGGSPDIFILKFNSNGVRIWATYYGGNGTDVGYSIQSQGGSVWIVGRGAGSIPLLNPGGGAYYQTWNAGSDIVILKFNTTGERLWATCYGGTSDEVAYSGFSDGTNFWVTGYTLSTNFPTLAPGGTTYQQAYNAQQDAIIIKFNTSGVRIWATYYGGSGGDWGNSIHSDGTNMWITGKTTSTNFPLLNPMAGNFHQGTFGGITDGHILQFNMNGQRISATYYGGSTVDESASIMSTGTNIWVAGQTQSTNFLTQNNGVNPYMQTNLSGNYDAFILKFTTTCGMPVISTVTASPSTICNGESTLLTVTGYLVNANSWQWYTGSCGGSLVGGGTNITQFPGTTTTYYVRGTGGCVGTSASCQTVTVTVNPLPNATIGSNSPVCEAQTLNLTSSGGTSYSWTGPLSFSSTQQNPSITNVNPAHAGTYSVEVTGGNGCKLTQQTNVSINAQPNATASYNFGVCEGQTLSLTSSGGISYSWTGPNGFTSTQQNPNITNVTLAAAGTYTVVVTGVNGCQKSAQTVVTIEAKPNVTIGSNSPVCVGQTLNLTSSGGVIYSWTGPNGFTSSNATPSIPSVTLAAAGIYSVNVTGMNGCSNAAQTNVTINTLPSPIAGNNGSVCEGQTLSLTSSGGISYSWTGPNGFTSTQQNPSITNVTLAAAGTYIVLVTGGNGCSNTAQTSVVVNPQPVATAGSNSPVCAGQTLSLSSSGGGTYSWNGPNGFSSSQQNPSITNVTLAAAGTYLVLVTGGNGCQKLAQTTVSINQPASISTQVTNANCGQSNGSAEVIILNGTGPYTYSWSNGGTSALIQNIPAGAYTITVTDGNNCQTQDVATVGSVGGPTVNVNKTNVTCQGGSNGIATANPSGGTPPYTYSWNNGATTQSISNLTEGTYTVTVTDYVGCITPQNTIISFLYALPNVVANASATTICEGDAVTLFGSGATNYVWNNAVTNNIPFVPLATNTYTVTGTDVNGCENTDQITVQVIVCTSIFDRSNNNDVIAYPNPTSDLVNIRINEGVLNSVLITDGIGNIVLSEKINSDNATIDLSTQARGLYFLHIESNTGERIVKKIIKN
ncbi:MAG: T9SS type A sorting domain-containing protein [Flavobacteriales bacterium]|nr:T9SS type A sorting domain-containing protein [Flavobacteriales bacterium]